MDGLMDNMGTKMSMEQIINNIVSLTRTKGTLDFKEWALRGSHIHVHLKSYLSNYYQTCRF